jgi:hypothetical protein
VIQITPQMRILVSVESVDFRKGIDGLCRVCREKMRSDPFSGYVFVFRNRSRRAIKILVYDGQGFWLCQKRLSRGRFRWWPVGREWGRQGDEERVNVLSASELQTLLWGGNPGAAGYASEWKKIGPMDKIAMKKIS